MLPSHDVGYLHAGVVPQLKLGFHARHSMTWRFEKVETIVRLCLINCDESGSMNNNMHRNAELFEAVASLFAGGFDVIIVHGFGSDSVYHVFSTPAGSTIAEQLEHTSLELTRVPDAERAVVAATKYLRGRQSWGSTNPRTHPVFLESLANVLDGVPATLDLVVASSSDGGFDGIGPQGPIREQMMRITARCRCLLAANLLVGSYGSPEALHFFTGDSDAFDNRLLFTTAPQTPEGVIAFDDFDPTSIGPLSVATGTAHITLQPATPLYHVADDTLEVYWPTGSTPPQTLTVRKHEAQPGGRELISVSILEVSPEPVTIDENARDVFALVAKLYTDNPYLRSSSRASLNEVMGQLEALEQTRDHVLARITARPDERKVIDDLEAQLADNTQAFAYARQQITGLRQLSARVNALNNARRLIKASLREVMREQAQRTLEREEAYMRAHPDHWVVWLAPIIEIIGDQLDNTQQPV